MGGRVGAFLGARADWWVYGWLERWYVGGHAGGFVFQWVHLHMYSCARVWNPCRVEARRKIHLSTCAHSCMYARGQVCGSTRRCLCAVVLCMPMQVQSRIVVQRAIAHRMRRECVQNSVRNRVAARASWATIAP